ncbi:MAG: hypothetical protein ACO3LZ_09205, partial [Candidatus Nanopelagicales bacterium]
MTADADSRPRNPVASTWCAGRDGEIGTCLIPNHGAARCIDEADGITAVNIVAVWGATGSTAVASQRIAAEFRGSCSSAVTTIAIATPVTAVPIATAAATVAAVARIGTR